MSLCLNLLLSIPLKVEWNHLWTRKPLSKAIVLPESGSVQFGSAYISRTTVQVWFSLASEPVQKKSILPFCKKQYFKDFWWNISDITWTENWTAWFSLVWLPNQFSNWTTVTLEGKENYENYVILDLGIDKCGNCKLSYHVKWSGYKDTPEETSWVLATKLRADELMEKFHKDYHSSQYSEIAFSVLWLWSICWWGAEDIELYRLINGFKPVKGPAQIQHIDNKGVQMSTKLKNYCWPFFRLRSIGGGARG